MGIRRRKTLKWIPNELVERAKRIGESKGMSDNEVIRMALRLGLEVIEREADIFEEIRKLRAEIEELKRGMGSGRRGDSFLEKLVEEV